MSVVQQTTPGTVRQTPIEGTRKATNLDRSVGPYPPPGAGGVNALIARSHPDVNEGALVSIASSSITDTTASVGGDYRRPDVAGDVNAGGPANGFVKWVLQAGNLRPPTVEQILAGKDSNGNAATQANAVAVTSGLWGVNLTTLVTATKYGFFAVWVDVSPGFPTRVSEVIGTNFTTL